MADNKWIWVAIVAVLIVGMFLQSRLDLFAILPAGESNVDPFCRYSTNVNPIDSSYNDYYTGAWLSIHSSLIPTMYLDSGNTWDNFGYVSSLTGTTGIRLGECDDSNIYTQLVAENINAAGDDIYYHYYSPQSSTNPHRVYVCNAVGDHSRYFKLNEGAASGAIIPTCSPTIPPEGNCLIIDANDNGLMDRSELGQAIQLWANS